MTAKKKKSAAVSGATTTQHAPLAVATKSSLPAVPPSLRNQALDLAVTVAGIYVSFMYYAMLQEQLTTVPQADGQLFSYPLFLLLTQCICNAVLGWATAHWAERRSLATGNKLTVHGPSTCQMREHHYALLALSYLCGMISSYIALGYMAYPAQVLIKSCKMMPVMLIGSLVFKQRYSLIEYLAVSLITVGIWAFFAAKDGKDASSDESMSTGIGIVMSMVSLTCDGITGSGQDHYCAKFKPSGELLMFKMNLWAVIELIVGCFLLSNQGVDGFRFVVAHPSLVGQLVTFGIVSAVGQVLIFHMVVSFGALPLSITTSTRKFFTILASAFYFGHRVNVRQWLAVAAVFAGLGLDIAKKAFNKKNKHAKSAHATHPGDASSKKEH